MGITENKTETTISGLGCRPLIDRPPPLNSDYNRDTSIKALERRWFINHGSTLGFRKETTAASAMAGSSSSHNLLQTQLYLSEMHTLSWSIRFRRCLGLRV